MQKTKLSHISNDILLEYNNMFKTGLQKSKRFESRKINQFDVKYAMHLVRLIYECEQILTECDIDLQRHNEHLKAIRRGDLTKEEILEWFHNREKYLEKLYQDSKIPHSPDEEQIKQLLLQCLETHYGSLEKCVVNIGKAEQALKDISYIIERYNE